MREYLVIYLTKILIKSSDANRENNILKRKTKQHNNSSFNIDKT